MKKQLLIMALGLCSAVWAGDFEDGLIAYRKEDYVLALSKFELSAEQGNEKAQFILGLMYDIGQGAAKNDNEALNWYVKSAEQGSDTAQLLLGLKKAIEQNGVEAVYWLTKAAEQGNADAQMTLGRMYQENSMGVEENDFEAMRWYQKAFEQGAAYAQEGLNEVTEKIKYKKEADQGIASAQYMLAIMYYRGDGTTMDWSKAAHWHAQAAKQGHIEAQEKLAWMYEHGEGVEKNDVEAVFWYEKAVSQGSDFMIDSLNHARQRLKFANDAKQGDAEAQYQFAQMYYQGNGVKQDFSEAVLWYKKAAEQGHAAAQDNLGKMYGTGKGVEQNYTEAAQWHTKAAKQGHAEAKYNISWLYENGKGVRKNTAEAKRWRHEIVQSAEQGQPEDQSMLAFMYFFGQGIKQDETKAIHWFQKAAEQGHEVAKDMVDSITEKNEYLQDAKKGNANAQYEVGTKYHYRLGNQAEAVRWYTKAAKQGHVDAQQALDEIAKESKQ